jgi:hypothetical protein
VPGAQRAAGGDQGWVPPGDLFPPAGCIATNLETDGQGVVGFYIEQEHRLYSEAIRIVLSGKFHIEGRRVILEP